MDEIFEFLSSFFKSVPGIILKGVGVLVFLAISFRITCVNFVENYELAYKYDKVSGEIIKLDRTGYFVTSPFVVAVHAIDLRPMQVCITANRRTLNCKLVEFNPEGMDLFLAWHGRGDYEGPGNTSSSNGVSATTKTPFSEILMAYAFDGTGNSYPFLKVSQGTTTVATNTVTTVSAEAVALPPAAPAPSTMPVEEPAP